MADTLDNVPIPAGEWVDLYAATGLTVGSQLSVENVGAADVLLAVSAAQPDVDSDGYNVLKRDADLPYINSEGDVGAWAFCPHTAGKLNVSLSGVHGFAPLPAQKVDVHLTDGAFRHALVTLPGEIHTGFNLDDITVNFQYGVSAVDVVDAGEVTGTGLVGTDKATATVSSGAGVGTALLESKDAIRYRAGHECHSAQSVWFGEPEAGVNQYAGFLNADDGWCVGYQGLTFGLWFLEGGNSSFIAQAEFNTDRLDGTGPSLYDIDPQKGQVYRLTYTWHGALDMMLEVWTDTGRWALAHRFVHVNVASETHLENPNLPLAVRVERAAGTGANVIIKTGSWRGGIIAGDVDANNSSDRWFSVFVVNRTKTANPDHLITLRSKDLFNGKSNHIKAEVKILVSTNGTNKDLVFVASRLAALDAADVTAIEAGFADISADSGVEGSKAEFAMATTFTDDKIGDVAVVAEADQRANTDVQGFHIHPGDDVVFLVDGNANGTVSMQINFRELH